MRSAQQVVVYALQVQEEVDGVRQEVREVKRESKARRKRSREHDHVDGVKDSLLEPRCVRARCDEVCSETRQAETGRCALMLSHCGSQ